MTTAENSQTRTYELRAHDDQSVRYFEGDEALSGARVIDATRVEDVNIEVSGHVVWVFRNGIKISGQTTVTNANGFGPASLVIVALKGGDRDMPNTGVWLQNGLDSDGSVHVVLVSDGVVRVSQLHSAQEDHHMRAQSLSIFSVGAVFTGPWDHANYQMDLTYPSATADDAIDWLATHGALPNTHGAANALFSLVAGTWRETTPPPSP